MARRLPSYRYHKASQQAIVVLDDHSHYLGTWNSPESRAEYDRLIAEWLTRRRRQPSSRAIPRHPDLTINELIVAFLEHADTHYRGPDGRPTGHVANLEDALRPVRALYGYQLAPDFGPLALRAVREEMIRAGICRRTINDRVHRIRLCFRWAASNELLGVEVVQALETVPALEAGRSAAKESPGIKPVPVEKVEAVLPYLPKPVAAMVLLQLHSACRAGDVVQMRGADLDRSGPVWFFTPRQHKNAWRGDERVVYLGPRAQEVLAGVLKADPEAFLFSPRERVEELRSGRAAGRKTKRTPSERGRTRKSAPQRSPGACYTAKSYRQAVIRACDQAFPHPMLSTIKPKNLTAEQRKELADWRRLRRWSPLQLRHTAATTIRKQFGVEGAQLILGHRKADVTQIYAERDLARAQEIAARIG